MGEQTFDQVEKAVAGLTAEQVGLVADFARLLSSPAAATDSDLGEAAVAAFRVGAALEGSAGRWLVRFESWTGWALDGARSAAGWLASHGEVSRSRAGGVLKQARTVACLPAVGAASAAGALAPEKVRDLLDTRAKAAAVFDANEVHLVDTVKMLTVAGAQLFLATWLHSVLPEGGSDAALKDRHDTHLQLSGTLGGTLVKGWLDPETAAVVTGALDAEIDAWHRAGMLEGDTRSRSQLLAAALATLAGRHGDAGVQHGQPRPLACVLVDHDTVTGRTATAESPNTPRTCEIVGFGPVATETARRLLCDADISTVTTANGGGEVLNVGFKHRLATAAQRRALVVLSAGSCQFPGCDAPHTWCQAHHLVPFDPVNQTGPTDLNNLAFLCHRHHHAVHEGGFRMVRGPDGLTVHRHNGTLLTVPLSHRAPQRT